MADSQQLITTSTVSAPLPAHLQGRDKPMGTELLGKYVIPPRLKIVQQIRMSEIYKDYPDGACLVVPQMQMISDVLFDERTKKATGGDRYFLFTPIFFYPEFCLWNSLDMKGELPAIAERTSDPRHAIAIRARSPDKNIRQQPQKEKPEGKPMQYVEHLNFIVMPYHENQEINMKPVLISFLRGEHRTGRRLAEWIKARRTDIFGCVFQAIVGKHKNTAGQEWFGLNIDNPEPPTSPWVDDPATCKIFENAHKTFAETHAQGLLQANYDDEDLSAGAGSVDATSVKDAAY